MYGLCKAPASRRGQASQRVVMGFNTAAEVFLRRGVPRRWACPLYVTTADGSRGVKRLRHRRIAGDWIIDSTCACGPEPMLKALYNATDKPGQYSFEARMACGFGACMGCTCKTKYGAKRICKDGPVLQQGGDRMVSTAVTLCGVELDNPVIPASGTFGFRARNSPPTMTSTCLGSLSFKGTTQEAALRQSHCPASPSVPDGMLNSVGSAKPRHRPRDRPRAAARLRKIFHKPIMANISGFLPGGIRGPAALAWTRRSRWRFWR